MRKTQRRKGYATEAAPAMALLAFRKLGAKKVEIYCDVENPASIQVALNLGVKFGYQQKGGWSRLNGELATLNTYSCFDENQLSERKGIFL